VFFVGLFIVGNGRGALDQGRYAAAEINPPDKRASAVSRVVWGGTVGAVIGPLLVNPSGQFITTLGLPFDSGAAFATAVLMAVAGLLIGVLLIGVDFKGIASRISISTSKRATDDTTYVTTTKGNPILHSPIPRAAMITMACAQAAMALMMAVISLHMKNHGHEGDVGVVITAHVLGMFAFSPIIGKLADRFGRQTMIMVGVGTLGLGCIFCPMFLNTPWIMWSEFLVGLGWSMCYVSSSAMLTNSLAPTVRARTQGTTDLFVNVASGIGSLSSGLLLATFDFVFVSVVGLIITLLPLLALFNMRSATPRTANT
jgi:MFS family permease